MSHNNILLKKQIGCLIAGENTAEGVRELHIFNEKAIIFLYKNAIMQCLCIVFLVNFLLHSDDPTFK